MLWLSVGLQHLKTLFLSSYMIGQNEYFNDYILDHLTYFNTLDHKILFDKFERYGINVL